MESDKSSRHKSRSNRKLSNNCRRDSQRSSHESLPVIQPVNAYFKTATHYHSYCLADRSEHYDNDVATHFPKMAQQLEVQLKSQMFDGLDPIKILGLHFGLSNSV